MNDFVRFMLQFAKKHGDTVDHETASRLLIEYEASVHEHELPAAVQELPTESTPGDAGQPTT